MLTQYSTEKPDISTNSNGTKENDDDDDEERENLTESNKIFMLCEEMIKAYNTDRIKTLNLYFVLQSKTT